MDQRSGNNSYNSRRGGSDGGGGRGRGRGRGGGGGRGGPQVGHQQGGGGGKGGPHMGCSQPPVRWWESRPVQGGQNRGVVNPRPVQPGQQQGMINPRPVQGGMDPRPGQAWGVRPVQGGMNPRPCQARGVRPVQGGMPDRSLFVIVKAFAAGIILGTGFIHVLPDSFNMLRSICLSEDPWHNFPFSGFLAMLSAIVALMVIRVSSGASNNTSTIKPLVDALCFYSLQMFEGMGLGGCIPHKDAQQILVDALCFCFLQMFERMGLGGCIPHKDAQQIQIRKVPPIRFEKNLEKIRSEKFQSLGPPVYYADLAATRGRMFQEVMLEMQSPPSTMSSNSLTSSASASSTCSFDDAFYKLHEELEDVTSFI